MQTSLCAPGSCVMTFLWPFLISFSLSCASFVTNPHIHTTPLHLCALLAWQHNSICIAPCGTEGMLSQTPLRPLLSIQRSQVSAPRCCSDCLWRHRAFCSHSLLPLLFTPHTQTHTDTLSCLCSCRIRPMFMWSKDDWINSYHFNEQSLVNLF